jgi:hypothetical protein
MLKASSLVKMISPELLPVVFPLDGKVRAEEKQLSLVAI